MSVTARAELRCWVSRGRAGDLAAGARTRLERADAVHAVESVTVEGFRPTANDIRVDLVATLRLREDADADALTDAVGIIEATVTRQE